MRQEACRLEGELELSQRQLSDLQRSYDDVLDRLQQQGAVLLGALGAGDAGGDDGAMVAQVGGRGEGSEAGCMRGHTRHAALSRSAVLLPAFATSAALVFHKPCAHTGACRGRGGAA